RRAEMTRFLAATTMVLTFAFMMPAHAENPLPDEALVGVPGGSLITDTPEEGRELAMTIARHTIHNIKPDLDKLKDGRPDYSVEPDSLISAAQVVAIEFRTIAEANDYWRDQEGD